MTLLPPQRDSYGHTQGKNQENENGQLQKKKKKESRTFEPSLLTV